MAEFDELALHAPDDQRPQRPVEAAWDELDPARTEAAATPARVRLSDLAPDMMRLDAETKQITHAIRMAAYNAETTLARNLNGHYPRAADEAYALVREVLVTEFERPTKITFHQPVTMKLHAGNVDVAMRYALTPRAESTHVTRVVTLGVPWSLTLFQPLVVRAFRVEKGRTLLAHEAYADRLP